MPPHLLLFQNIIDTFYSDFLYPDSFLDTLVVPNHASADFDFCHRHPRHLQLGVMSLLWDSSGLSVLLSLLAPPAKVASH